MNRLRRLSCLLGWTAWSAASPWGIPSLNAAVPNAIPFQGRVSVDGVPFTGTGHFRFALLDSTGQARWTSAEGPVGPEGEPDSPIPLPVTKGLYSVTLGEPPTSPLPAKLFEQNSGLRLRVWFDDGSHGTQRLTPDQPLSSVAYARRSASAETADLAETARMALSVAGDQKFTGNTTFSGRVGIGLDPSLTSASEALGIVGDIGVYGSTGMALSSGDSTRHPVTLSLRGYQGVTGTLGIASDTGDLSDAAAWGDVVLKSGLLRAVILQNGDDLPGLTLRDHRVSIGNGGHRGGYYGGLDVDGTVVLKDKLEVAGGATLNDGLDVVGQISLRDRAADGVSLLLSCGGNGHDWRLGSYQDGSFRIADTDARFQSGRFVIDAAGRVGIGVFSPDAPLSIRRDSANDNFGYCIALTDRDGTPWWKIGARNNARFSIGAAGLRDEDISISRGSGNVGIGIGPDNSHKLRVGGHLMVEGEGHSDGGYWLTSDVRRKTDLGPLDHALSRVGALRGVTFTWLPNEQDQVPSTGRQVGFIAQEVAAVLPELVHTNTAGQLSVNYNGVTPVLVEAVKELQQRFEKRLAEKEAQLGSLQARLTQLEGTLSRLTPPPTPPTAADASIEHR